MDTEKQRQHRRDDVVEGTNRLLYMYMDTNLHLKSLWTTVYIIHSWLCHSLRLTDVPLGANLALLQTAGDPTAPPERVQ